MEEISVKLNEFPTIHVSLGNVNISQHPKPTSHSLLEDRDGADQHPISAITGLSDALDLKIEQRELDSAVDSALGEAKDRGDFDGKNAYEYAKDAGYAGSEADFAEKLAADCSSVHIGPSAPEKDADLWIDTDEEPEKEEIKIPTPDYAASEDEDGHILNRTHFVDKDGVVHKLDNKYIDADWMATSEEHIATAEVIPEQTVSTTWSNLQYLLQPGIIYDVYINGVVYPCTAWGSGAVILGNNTSLSKNDYPFSVYWAGGTATMGMFFYDENVFTSPIYLKVTEHSWTEYNKLPEEFLPDGVARTLIGTTDGIKPSEVAAALSEGRTVALTYADGGMIFNAFTVSGNAVSSSVTVVDTQYQLHGTLDTDIWSFASTPVSSGGADIDAIASVGQTIVVEEVDTSGKPTKWKSADYQPRTHWMEEKTVLLEEATAECNDNGTAFFPYVALEGGKIYKVNYNGAEYVVVNALDVGNGTVIMGNGGAFDESLPTSSDPFVIMSLNDDVEQMTGCVPLDGSTSVTLSIVELICHTIPKTYLPKTTCVVDVQLESNTSSVAYVHDLDTTEIVTAILNDLPIYVNLVIPSSVEERYGTLRLPAVIINPQGYQGNYYSSVKEAFEAFISAGTDVSNFMMVMYVACPHLDSWCTIYINYSED